MSKQYNYDNCYALQQDIPGLDAGTTHGVFAMFFNYKQPKEQSNDQ
jgi:hypothetical protein